tara:strand:+ start:5270 stop:7699 length:2430 start_codon:yes stop_codon:yes gene_type:complete
VEFNQSFLAPSIPKPKLSKRNISSSVLKGSDSAAKTLSSQKSKLKTSTFNFLKEKKSVQDITKNPQLSIDAEFISSSLVEVNKLLVETQKQLSLAKRLSEKKPELKTPTFSFLKKKKPELKTSTFNFLKEKKSVQNIAKNPQLSADTELISSSLVETNKILVEIQKQLELDFTNRIAEQKNLLKTARIQKEKQSRVRKEFSLEKFGGVAKKITGLFAPITKPVKSIFDKIKEFLGIILSGVILEKAFDWLSKKENREKISNIFNFLTKNWKLLVGLLIGTKVIGGLIKLVTFIRRIGKALKFLGKGFGRGRRGGTTTTTKTKTQRRGGLLKGRRKRTPIGTRSTGRFVNNRLYKTEVSQFAPKNKNVLQKGLQKTNIAMQKIGKNLMKSMGMGPGAKGLSKLLRPIFKRIPVFGPLIDFAVSLALGESLGRAAAKSIGAALGAALGTLIPIPGVGTIAGGVVGDLLGGSVYDMLVKPKEEAEEGPPKMEKGGMIGGKLHSEGGTIIEAEKGEYIIDKINTQRYLPVLASIKYQGGSSWDAFTNAVKLQENIIEEQIKTENRFTEFLDSLKDFYDEKYRELQVKKLKSSPTPEPTPEPPPPAASPAAPKPTPEPPPPAASPAAPKPRPTKITKKDLQKFIKTENRSGKGITIPELGMRMIKGSDLLGITETKLFDINSGKLISSGDTLDVMEQVKYKLYERGYRKGASDVEQVIKSEQVGKLYGESVIPVSMPHKNLKTSSMYGKNGGMNFIELPPVVMNGESNLPKIPTFKPKEDSLNLPEISPFDHFNDYLNTSISYYDIEGIKFGGE